MRSASLLCGAFGFDLGDLLLLELGGALAHFTGLLLDDVDGEEVRGVSVICCRPRLLLEERLDLADRLRRPSITRAGETLGVSRTRTSDSDGGLDPLLDEKCSLGPTVFKPHGQSASAMWSATLSKVR